MNTFDYLVRKVALKGRKLAFSQVGEAHSHWVSTFADVAIQPHCS